VEIEDAQDAPEVEEGTCRELLCGLQVFFLGMVGMVGMVGT
jgi:hypothetical protein